MKFKNKKEEWEVKETMIALLTPLINHLDNRTKKACEITLRILAETNIESEDKLCIICANNGMLDDECAYCTNHNLFKVSEEQA